MGVCNRAGRPLPGGPLGHLTGSNGRPVVGPPGDAGTETANWVRHEATPLVRGRPGGVEVSGDDLPDRHRPRLSSPCPMPPIISAIITVQTTAATRNPEPATPVATSTTAMTSIGTQQASIIQRCPPFLPGPLWLLCGSLARWGGSCGCVMVPSATRSARRRACGTGGSGPTLQC